jgi:hypothetical protein
MSGWEGEEGWFWVIVFAYYGEEAGEVYFGGVGGDLVAENANFDFFCAWGGGDF